MKGTILTDAMSTVALVIIFIFLLFMIPMILEQIKDMFVSNSPRVVSRDIAGIATVSAASPYNIDIYYSSRDDMRYDIEFKDNFVSVEYTNPALKGYDKDTSPMGLKINSVLNGVNLLKFTRTAGTTEVFGYEK